MGDLVMLYELIYQLSVLAVLGIVVASLAISTLK